MVFDNSPGPRGPVTISGVHWDETWNLNQSASRYQFPTILGNSCSNATSINTSGTNFTCVFGTRPADYLSGSPHGYAVISNITVQAPFTVIGYRPVAGGNCIGCSTEAWVIGLPDVGGTYLLNATLVFTGLTVV